MHHNCCSTCLPPNPSQVYIAVILRGNTWDYLYHATWSDGNGPCVASHPVSSISRRPRCARACGRDARHETRQVDQLQKWEIESEEAYRCLPTDLAFSFASTSFPRPQRSQPPHANLKSRMCVECRSVFDILVSCTSRHTCKNTNLMLSWFMIYRFEV